MDINKVGETQFDNISVGVDDRSLGLMMLSKAVGQGKEGSQELL